MMNNQIIRAIITAIIFLTVVGINAQDPFATEKYRVYFGSGATRKGEGIYYSILDIQTGQFSEVQLAGEAMRARVITLHPKGTNLYTVGQPAGYQGPGTGMVCAYKIDPSTGTLEFLNHQETRGAGPCYLTVDPEGRNLLAANYMGGSCAVLPLRKDGYLKPVSSFHQHKGQSVHPRRQSKPHAHAIVLDSAARYAFVSDLGLDQILIYKFNPDSGTLLPNEPAFTKVKPGGGPRHFVLHPSEKYAYTNLELTSEVTGFTLDSEKGILQEFQTLSTLPDDYQGRNANAGIVVTPDGRYLYVSNRGHNSIAQYAIDPESGSLSTLGFESTRGLVPTVIKIDPGGNYLITTDFRGGGRMSLFKINADTGLLEYSGTTLEIPRVGSLEYLLMD